ncbi:SH2 domain-containing protein 4B [Callorhinchus milii]|uniref:SH2 domain-containing protein 4B n=1 Tax=Callorhinchus milii TaxID=7868 RepID=UPI001C3F828D|nr:SH2 domain-containing protein 4B [Callorhinchus milii]
MLQQILQDMYIDPEVLDQLNEEQKHILFLKMRQEQVRRWKEREERSEREEKKRNEASGQKDSSKRVKWLLGNDGDVWVWVMGEARGDKSYEEICSDISTKASTFTESSRTKVSVADHSSVAWKSDEQINLSKGTDVQTAGKVTEDHSEKWKKHKEEKSHSELYVTYTETHSPPLKPRNKQYNWKEKCSDSLEDSEQRQSVVERVTEERRHQAPRPVQRGKVAELLRNFNRLQDNATGDGNGSATIARGMLTVSPPSLAIAAGANAPPVYRSHRL